jgi:hypothetical protein
MTARRLALLVVIVTLVQPVSAQEDPAPRLLDEIRQEATRPNHGDAGRPLPLAAHWNTSGADRRGFSPTYQLQLLKEGRHILPWLDWPPTDAGLDALFKKDDPRRQKYIDSRLSEYEPIIKELARLRLPISFLATHGILSSALPEPSDPNQDDRTPPGPSPSSTQVLRSAQSVTRDIVSAPTNCRARCTPTMTCTCRTSSVSCACSVRRFFE